MNDSNKEYRSRLQKNGLITLAVALAILLVLVAINLAISALPTNIKSIDLTEEKMYSVTDSTKRILAKTETAVSIYLFCHGGEAALTDNAFHLDAFLKNVATVSNKITYRMVDPYTDTTLMAELGLESANNLSVLVKSALRSRTISSSEFFSYYVDGVGKVDESTALYYYYYYGLTPSYIFDGEALLLGAVDYVCDPNLPTIYTLSTHSETALSDTLLKALDAAHFNVATLSAASSSHLSACDMLVINAPQTDLTVDEVSLFLQYINAGGTILLTTTPDSAIFPNLASLAAAMGMAAQEGIVVETNSAYYYNAQAPYYLIPAKAAHATTQSEVSILLTFSHGIQTIETAEGVTVSPLFTTSQSAYMLPIDAETLQQPEDTELTAFCVSAVSQNAAGGKLIWIASNGLTNDSANQAINGGNYAFFTECARWVCESGTIPTANPLPLSTPRLEVETTTAALLSAIIIFIIPLSFIGYGLFFVIRRKKK